MPVIRPIAATSSLLRSWLLWLLYFRFPLSLRIVQDSCSRGIIARRQTISASGERFGRHFANHPSPLGRLLRRQMASQ